MKKIIASVLLSSVVLLNQQVMAASLGADMWALSRHYKAFNKADNGQDALKSLDAMRNAAKDAKLTVPKKLKALPQDDAQVLMYQAGLDTLIAELDKASALVQVNQLEQAKLEAQNILTIRDENHQKFK